MEDPVADEEPPHRTTGSSFPVHAGLRVTLGRRRCKDSMDAFAHATDEVLEIRPSLSSGISAAIAAERMRPRYIADAPAHCVAMRFLLFDALASGVVKHRHDALFEGEVAAVVLRDGHAFQSTSATATYLKAPASGDIFSISWT